MDSNCDCNNEKNAPVARGMSLKIMGSTLFDHPQHPCRRKSDQGHVFFNLWQVRIISTQYTA